MVAREKSSIGHAHCGIDVWKGDLCSYLEGGCHGNSSFLHVIAMATCDFVRLSYMKREISCDFGEISWNMAKFEVILVRFEEILRNNVRI